MPSPHRPPPRGRFRRRWVAVVAVSVTVLAVGLLRFFSGLPQAPTDVLDVLDKQASVVSMFVGIAGLFIAGAALLTQLRNPGSPPHSVSIAPEEPAGTLQTTIRTVSLVEAPLMAVSSARQALPPVADVLAGGIIGLPRRPSTVFVGRDDELEALRQAAMDGPGANIQAVVGLGGIGKSELALHYAIRHRDAYRLVWWIDAEGPDNIQAGLAGLCRALCTATAADAAAQAPAEEAVAWALAWLGSSSDWLVVFDNVEEIEDVQPYMGRLHTGHVLITSRRDVGWQEMAAVLHLGVLSRPEAVRLLARTIGDTAWDETLAAQLAEEVGDLPLVLKQAGAYIAATPGMDVGRYLHLLRTTPQRVLAAEPHWWRDADRVVARTWAVTSARIAQIDPLAMRLLRLLAYYAPDRLPCQVLCKLRDADEVAVAEALGALVSYSMIGRSADGREVSVHRLVQAITRVELPEDERVTVRAAAGELLEATLPADPEAISSWPLYARLLPHARTVLTPGSAGMGKIIDYLHASGDYRAAHALQQQRLEALVGRLGSEHPDTLAARHNLAFWTGGAGDAAGARDELAALLLMRERVLGSEHPDTLATRHSLAYWTGKAGDAAAARDELAALLPIRERVLGSEHPDTLTTRQDLAYWTRTAEERS